MIEKDPEKTITIQKTVLTRIPLPTVIAVDTDIRK